MSLFAHEPSCTLFFRCLVFFWHEFQTQVAVAADSNDATTNSATSGQNRSVIHCVVLMASVLTRNQNLNSTPN
jgi:hypothetical protein